MAAADLGGFLEAAGRSLADAQGALAGEVPDLPTAIAISEAELEIRATVARSTDGEVVVEPVSTTVLRQSAIPPGLLSTVRIRYVAVAPDAVAPASVPERTRDDVVGEVTKRPDVAALDRILDGLLVDAVFVPSTRAWVVTALDSERRVVRRIVVPDG